MLSSFLLIFAIGTGTASAGNGLFTYMVPDQKAPFKGTLFDDRATAHLMSLPEYYEEQCNLNSQYKLDIQKEEFDLQIKKLKGELKFQKEEIDRITKEKNDIIDALEGELKIKNKDHEKWYFVGGVAIGVGLTIGIVRSLETQ